MIKKLHFLVLAIIGLTGSSFAQTCYQQVSSASNIYSMIVNRTNQLVVNNDLNTLVFIHRADHTVSGGHSGQLRYDISTDGGTTWTNNLGILNPTADATLTAARYPQAIIHNPTGNTVPNNAYVVYKAPVVTNGLWGSSVNGVRKLDGTGNTENYASTVTQQLIPGNLCKGAPGVYWTIDAIYTGSAYTGFRIWKGTWTGTDVSWAVNYTSSTGFVTSGTSIQLADWSIGFDPSGTIGWAVLISHATNGPTYNQYHPVLFKTIDGGTTWSGPISVNYDNLRVVKDGLPANSFAANFFEVDIAVDINGNPHILTQVNNGPGTGYTVYPNNQRLFDITHDGTNWQARFVADLTAHRGYFGASVSHDNRPQISMTDDGTKIFYTWLDSDPPVSGNANNQPNLFARGYDVLTGNWTCSKKMATLCSSTLNNKIHTNTVSPNVLMSGGNYVIPFMTAQLNATTLSDLDPATFHFSKEMVFAPADFTNSASIILAGPPTICGGTPIVLTAPNATSYEWSNLNTSSSLTVNTADTFYVKLGSGLCKLISDPVITALAPYPPTPSIAVNGSLSFCDGDSVELASPSASTYLWSNNDTNQFLFAKGSGSYSVTVSNSQGCTSTSAPVNVNVFPLPTPPIINFDGPTAFCDGDSTIISSSYANNNFWVNGSTTQSITVYTQGPWEVVHTDANGCVSVSDPVTVVVHPTPGVPIISSSGPLVFCEGDSVILTSSSANGYLWSNGSMNPTVTIHDTENLSVLITDSNGCTNESAIVEVVALIVPDPPTISVAGNTEFCDGESATLSSNYSFGNTWSTGLNAQSMIVAQSGVYSVVHQGSNGCVSDPEFVQITVYPNPPAPIVDYQNGILSTVPLGGGIEYQWYHENSLVSGATGTEHTPTVNGWYHVEVTDANGCTSSSVGIYVQDVGIAESEFKLIKVYPNPFPNSFNINSGKPVEQVMVFNSIGKLIYQDDNKNQNTDLNIDLEKHAPGVYMIQLRLDGATRNIKMVKQ